MKGKYKRKNKANDALPKAHISGVNAGEKQKHAREEQPEPEKCKANNGMNSVSKWWRDPAHVIQSIGILIGTLVAIIYACQLHQMIEANRINHEALTSTQRAYVTIGRKDGYHCRVCCAQRH